MKYSKTIAAMAILSTLIFTDCSKSDPAPPSIVGKWKITSYVQSACDLSTDNQTRLSDNSYIIYQEYKSDGTYSVTGNSSYTGTYTISGNNITLSDLGSPVTYPFTVTATTLTIIVGPNSIRVNPNRASGYDKCQLTNISTRQ